MVHSSEVAIVDNCIFSSQSRLAMRNPLPPAGPAWSHSRRKGTIGEPPQETNADDYSNEAVKKEHPSR